ncbi:GNAT family N-acetyltransferase [Asanoa sp. WMMD1127]|uniref:GNAT family N-acetyltransferase n=1 Tax=Asanoa sp. WMMD1127 TaxID=3016107 RepID=UPI002416A655|nr:GNAT family N-acetyltransferase [Asanoa sp. WMMD1127]MDG4825013.1 GNAT family N-acetyltransferase [Asanoa sp. WMMD1127]
MSARFETAIQITGLGIQLREWSDADVPAMRRLFDDGEVDRWTPLRGPFDLAIAQKYLDNARHRRAESRSIQLAITTDGHTALGEILLFPTGPGGRDPAGASAELAYAVGAEHRRQGLTSRAVRLMTDYAYRRLQMEKVLLRIDPANAASVGVARATGFKPVRDEVGDLQDPLRTWIHQKTSTSGLT